MTNNEFITIIKDYCEKEEIKEEGEIREIYNNRLNEYIEGSVISPNCRNCLIEDKNSIWINPNKIILQNGFSFYHYKPEEILDFAILKRGDAKFLISQMSGPGIVDYLDLQEYPSPFTTESVYMVRMNGNHRTGVFRSINLPFVNANIGLSKSDKWKYKSYLDKKYIIKILNLFKEINLIDFFEEADYGEFIIKPTIGLSIWILPGNDCKTLCSAVKDIKYRLRLIEHVFENVNNYDVSHLKSKKLLFKILFS